MKLASMVFTSLEGLTKNEIIACFERNKIISAYQFGFVGRKSTLTQLLMCFDSWTRVVDSNEAVKVVYSDFKKAFNSFS